jgi:hypothetical protein
LPALPAERLGTQHQKNGRGPSGVHRTRLASAIGLKRPVPRRHSRPCGYRSAIGVCSSQTRRRRSSSRLRWLERRVSNRPRNWFSCQCCWCSWGRSGPAPAPHRRRPGPHTRSAHRPGRGVAHHRFRHPAPLVGPGHRPWRAPSGTSGLANSMSAVHVKFTVLVVPFLAPIGRRHCQVIAEVVTEDLDDLDGPKAARSRRRAASWSSSTSST